MTERAVAIAVMAAFFAIAGAFTAAVLLGPHDTVAVATDTDDGIQFSADAGQWRIAGNATIGSGRALRVEFALADIDGRPISATLAPVLHLEMPEIELPPLNPPVARIGPDSFAAEETLPAAGIWRVRIELPTGIVAFSVDVDT